MKDSRKRRMITMMLIGSSMIGRVRLKRYSYARSCRLWITRPLVLLCCRPNVAHRKAFLRRREQGLKAKVRGASDDAIIITITPFLTTITTPSPPPSPQIDQLKESRLRQLDFAEKLLGSPWVAAFAESRAIGDYHPRPLASSNGSRPAAKRSSHPPTAAKRGYYKKPPPPDGKAFSCRRNPEASGGTLGPSRDIG
jgi:hypothetical protein